MKRDNEAWALYEELHGEKEYGGAVIQVLIEEVDEELEQCRVRNKDGDERWVSTDSLDPINDKAKKLLKKK